MTPFDERLLQAERDYRTTPVWHTWKRYNRLRLQAGLERIPIPKEKGTINVLPGFFAKVELRREGDSILMSGGFWEYLAEEAEREQEEGRRYRRNPDEPELCQCRNCHRWFPLEDAFE